MLQELTIKNFALIDAVSFAPSQNLSTITGETGAGKSILLGALGLILGKRADHSMFFNKEKKCVIEGKFHIADLKLTHFFEEHDIDYEEETLLRREILPNGKTRMFVNDSPVGLSQMKTLGNRLVDIHSQHQSLDINNAAFQLWALDQVAGNAELLEEYDGVFKEYTTVKKELETAITLQIEAEKEKDFNQFQFDELEKMNWKVGEEESIEEALRQMENSEEIVSVSMAVANALNGEENAITDTIKQLLSDLKSVSNVHSGIQSIKTKITELTIDLAAYADDLQAVADSTELDNEKLEELNERFNTLNNQLKKHQVTTTEALLEVQSALSDKLLSITEGGDEIEKLELKLEQCLSKLKKIAKALHVSRKKHCTTFCAAMEEELRDLGIPHAKMEIELEELEEFNATGMDKANYLFTANPSIGLQAIQKSASGGEISRVVFSLKKILSSKVSLPTLILDEIDTGVSGEIAAKMGQKMKEMAQDIQLIVITHLPQVAAKGDAHFYVYKEQDTATSKSNIKQLTEPERVETVAKMLSGETTSHSAMENAKELLSLSAKGDSVEY